MTWTKLPDDLPDRLIEVSDAAFRLHVSATVYANRVGLDGRISRNRLSFVPAPAKARRSAVMAELVTAGLWSETVDGWEIVGFLDDQPSADEVAATREWDRLRQRIRFKKGTAAAELLAQERAAFEALNAARERRRCESSARRNGGDPADIRRPVPTRPVPPQSEDEGGSAGTALDGGPADRGETCGYCGALLDYSKDVMAFVEGSGMVHRDKAVCLRANQSDSVTSLSAVS